MYKIMVNMVTPDGETYEHEFDGAVYSSREDDEEIIRTFRAKYEELYDIASWRIEEVDNG